jgi:hypothetical protein
VRNPADLRERYGSVFVLELPDGLVVPFSLLSLSDFFTYSKILSSDIIPSWVIENEIFTKCVKDEVLIDNIYQQKAGTPTTVANTILQYSAPNSQEELGYFLNYNRSVVDNSLYQLINTICLAYSYTPDDLLRKDIQEIFFLFALAERKLLDTGILSEPFDFENKNTKKPRKQHKVDLSKLSEEYRQQEEEWNLRKLRQQGTKSPGMTVENETPSFNDTDKNGDTVISGRELMYNLDADPTSDSPVESQMMEDAKVIFGDYLEALKKGEKIKIKSEDQRIAEAKKRLEENRRKLRKK